MHREAVELYESDGMVQIDSIDNISNFLIKTTKIKTYLSILKCYLDEGIPFNIIGPSGSGTRFVLIILLFFFCSVNIKNQNVIYLIL